MQTGIVDSGKGQMKIQQMAFMLLAVTLFFVLAGMFFLVTQMGNLKKSATEQEARNAENLVISLSNAPEFSCQNAFDNSGTSCIDLDKVMALKENIDKYNKYWGKNIENIEIRRIYPEESEILCNMQNYPNCNTIRIYNSKVSGTYYTNYVAICRKAIEEGNTYDKCELAHLMISYSDYE